MILNGVNGKLDTSPFRYVRPTFDHYGSGEQPDKRVRAVLNELAKALGRGFHDIADPGRAAAVGALKQQLADLEDENVNGLNGAKAAQIQASQSLGEVDQKIRTVSTEISRLRGQMSQLKRRPGVVAAGSTATAVNVPTREELQKQLDEKQSEKGRLDLDKVRITTALRAADIDYDARLDKVRLDLVEVKRKLRDAEAEPDAAQYAAMFDLTTYLADSGAAPRTTFQNKIGSDPRLHGLYLIVEDRVQRSNTPFNASLFFAIDDLLRFVFLRAFYADGLRDAEAIADRILDEQEGGVKHIYDFVVAEVVHRILAARKLI